MLPHTLDQVPDSIKLSTSALTPVLAFAGVPIEQWVFVLSAILTTLFIIEKIPRVMQSLKWIYLRLKRKKRASGQ
jgi:hypothetical protein